MQYFKEDFIHSPPMHRLMISLARSFSCSFLFSRPVLSSSNSYEKKNSSPNLVPIIPTPKELPPQPQKCTSHSPTSSPSPSPSSPSQPPNPPAPQIPPPPPPHQHPYTPPYQPAPYVLTTPTPQRETNINSPPASNPPSPPVAAICSIPPASART